MTAETGKTNRRTVVVFLLTGLLLAAAVVCFFVVDERVFSYLRNNPQTWHRDHWAQALKQFGRAYPLIWLLLVWVWVTGKHKTVIVCLLSLLITLAAVTVIKETVRRPRPRDAITAETKAGDEKDTYRSWSFPSGDTASVFAAGAVLAFAVRWPVTILFAVCCSGVAILRVAVLAHYPSDVLGGAATGILSGWLAISIRNRYPGIENIFNGWERIISIAGVILVPILIWRLQGLDELIILLEFYAPIALIIAVVDRRRQLKRN